MRNQIKREIKHRCKKIAIKKAAILRKKEEYRRKFEKRTGLTAGLSLTKMGPPIHRHFDCDFVARKASHIARGIWANARANRYAIIPAILHRIPKSSGKGKREIMEFAIADAAFANVINKRLLARNLKRYSGNSFAYRPDRNQFDAIISLKNYLKLDKVYVVQFDFKAYFDTIPHRYIRSLLDESRSISISSLEKRVVDTFMQHEYAIRMRYAAKLYDRKSDIGTPQGLSISLFLANMSNDELDRRLENTNGQFVRYADDVVAVAGTYEDAIKIEKAFHEHCRGSGLQINVEKSDGIRLLAPAEKGEINSINSFKFLGYDFFKDGCAVSSKSTDRIKTKISRLIQLYLIQYPSTVGFNHKRVEGGSSLPFYDWDLLGLLAEIRNYLYGGCSEAQINDLIYKGRKIPPMRGLMSFYALVDKVENLRSLDGWLVNNLRCALVKRKEILNSKYKIDYPRFSNSSLITGRWYNSAYNESDFIPDTTLPSFVRGWRAARKYYLTFGLDDAAPPPYSGY